MALTDWKLFKHPLKDVKDDTDVKVVKDAPPLGESTLTTLTSGLARVKDAEPAPVKASEANLNNLNTLTQICECGAIVHPKHKVCFQCGRRRRESA
jgi:hypothetical protein